MVKRLLSGLLIAYFTVSFALFLHRLVLVVAYPYELAQGEGIQLYEAVKLRSGAGLYNDINSHPYLVCNYPPLYQTLCAAGLAVTGKTSFLFGRALSAAASLGIGVLIFLIVFKASRSILNGLFAFFSFYSFWYVYDWAPFHRVDMPGIFLGLAGIYLIQEYRGEKYLPAAAALFVLSLFTKQSLVFAPLSAVLFLFTIQKKKAFALILLLILPAAAMAFILNTLSDGQFVKHMLISFQGSFGIKRSLEWFMNFLRSYPVYIALASYALYRAFSAKNIPAYAWYAALSVLTAIGVGKFGAYSNYYIELCAGIAIMSGLLWKEAINHRLKYISAGVLLFTCLQLNNLTAIEFDADGINISRKPGWTHNPVKTDYENGARLVETIKGLEGPGFSETDTIHLILAGKDLQYHQFLPAYIPVWNPDNFLQDVRQGKYSFFIFKDGGDTTLGHDTLLQYFELKDKIGEYTVYTRKQAQIPHGRGNGN